MIGTDSNVVGIAPSVVETIVLFTGVVIATLEPAGIEDSGTAGLVLIPAGVISETGADGSKPPGVIFVPGADSVVGTDNSGTTAEVSLAGTDGSESAGIVSMIGVEASGVDSVPGVVSVKGQ